jgi:hypothetical protein
VSDVSKSQRILEIRGRFIAYHVPNHLAEVQLGPTPQGLNIWKC